MKYLNQFHKEAMERTMKKIAESKKNSVSQGSYGAYDEENRRIQEKSNGSC